MKYEENEKQEELLNGYIDGELSAEERSKVERLVSENSEIAERLRKIEKCKILVSSLPPAEPPAVVVAGIKQLVRSNSAGAVDSEIARRQGARHLFIRQALAASIIIGVLGMMGAVVYKIVGPMENTTPRVVVTLAPTNKPNAVPAVVKPEETPKAVAVVAPAGEISSIGHYSLQLQTADFTAMDAYVNKLLEESPWLRYKATKNEPGQSKYRILCSRVGLEAMVSDLASVWSKFDSTTLVVRTDTIGNSITVTSVKPEQIANIARQSTSDERVKLAKDFATLNSIEQITPGEKMLAATPETMTIPKPVLTSANNPVTAPKGAWDKIQVDLNITVTSSASLTNTEQK
jgi:anti-sigma-K factor RskA